MQPRSRASTSAACTGASSRSARTVTSSPEVWPRSTNSTNPGHAAEVELDPATGRARRLGDGGAVGAGGDRPDGSDHRRPAPMAVASTRAADPGPMTSSTGTGSSPRRSSSPAAAAVLQATMTAFDVVVLDEAPRQLPGVGTDVGERLGPVRVAPGVADVHEVLGRQQVDQRRARRSARRSRSRTSRWAGPRAVRLERRQRRVMNQAMVYPSELVATWASTGASRLPDAVAEEAQPQPGDERADDGEADRRPPGRPSRRRGRRRRPG